MLKQINRLHRLTGQVLLGSLRTLWVIAACGVFFIALTYWTQQIINQPTRMMNLDGMMANVQDYAEITASAHASGALANGDPSWDGAAAGFSLGCAYTSAIPIVGPILSPLLGAIVGYELDSSI